MKQNPGLLLFKLGFNDPVDVDKSVGTGLVTAVSTATLVLASQVFNFIAATPSTLALTAALANIFKGLHHRRDCGGHGLPCPLPYAPDGCD